MKKVFTLILGFTFSFTGLAQSCLPEGITFTTQSQIDGFQTNYPNCSTIIGDVKINGLINNLNGLNVLSSIESALEIRNCDGLTNLFGLNNLESIGDRLFLINNDSLVNLTGLESLESIGNGLWIWANDNLSSLTGLDNLTSSGTLFIFWNDNLSDITALNNLISVEDILFTRNHSLTNLEGLNNITSCYAIQIDENDLLADISALSNLTTVNNGIIRLYNNQTLTSLTGLDNIEGSSISNLLVWDNFNLSICNVQSVCDYLANPDAESNIHDNANGCNSREEVETECGVSVDDQITPTSHLTILPNPSCKDIFIKLPIINLPNNATLTIYNVNAQRVISRSITEPQTVVDISSLPCGVYFARITTDRAVMVGKFVRR